MLSRVGLVLFMFFSLSSIAGELKVALEIPRLDVAEYHRPYTALWIEREGEGVVANLAVWYDLEMREDKGEEWLKDMRQWWRRTGRELEMPIDGVSGATRAPGTHTINFTEGNAPLGKLTAGQYTLMLEAAREVGGREVLKIPFQWPPKQEQTLKAQGKNELGVFELTLIP
jgi:hypothetical protein